MWNKNVALLSNLSEEREKTVLIISLAYLLFLYAVYSFIWVKHVGNECSLVVFRAVQLVIVNRET